MVTKGFDFSGVDLFDLNARNEVLGNALSEKLRGTAPKVVPSRLTREAGRIRESMKKIKREMQFTKLDFAEVQQFRNELYNSVKEEVRGLVENEILETESKIAAGRKALETEWRVNATKYRAESEAVRDRLAGMTAKEIEAYAQDVINNPRPMYPGTLDIISGAVRNAGINRTAISKDMKDFPSYHEAFRHDVETMGLYDPLRYTQDGAPLYKYRKALEANKEGDGLPCLYENGATGAVPIMEIVSEAFV